MQSNANGWVSMRVKNVMQVSTTFVYPLNLQLLYVSIDLIVKVVGLLVPSLPYMSTFELPWLSMCDRTMEIRLNFCSVAWRWCLSRSSHSLDREFVDLHRSIILILDTSSDLVSTFAHGITYDSCSSSYYKNLFDMFEFIR